MMLIHFPLGGCVDECAIIKEIISLFQSYSCVSYSCNTRQNNRFYCTYVLVMSRTRFRVSPHSIVESTLYSWIVSEWIHTLVSLAKQLSVRLRTKWLWVRVQFQSLLLCILCLKDSWCYKHNQLLKALWKTKISETAFSKFRQLLYLSIFRKR